MEGRKQMIAFRLDPRELEKLDELARATDRDRSKLLRALLRRASVTAAGELRVGEEAHRDQAT